MNITRRRGAIATFITLGALLTGMTVTLNIGWIILNKARVALMILGIVFFAVLVAGVVLNTVFLVREIRRNERQDSFLNAVTHELKTPIASIRLYLETLQRRELTEEKRQEFYRVMHADSDRLLSTVERVLKAGELGQRQRDRAVIEFDKLVAECVDVIVSRYHLPTEALVLEPVPGAVKLRVLGIGEDLRTAVLNVLDNAVKYSPVGVTVRCSLAIQDYSKVALTVRDEGLGMEAGQLKLIFKRFYRVPGRYSVKIKGTGLGLFLVRTIVRQHGGEIEASSAGLTKGTTMVVTLPLAS